MFKRAVCGLASIGLMMTVLAPSVAHAADMGGSIKDAAPAPNGRKIGFSANIGVTSDYVFRGFSQKNENPALQGGFDITYGSLYAGVWGSGIDFGNDANGNAIAPVEVDWYAGYKTTLGMVSVDVGVIYYTYPDAVDAGAELDYVEGKLSLGTSLNKLGVSGTVYYSPEYTGEIGPATTLEGGLSYELAKFGDVTPSVSGLVGTTLFSDDSSLDYVYWNAGIGLGFGSNFSLDFRYWGTDTEGFCGGAATNLCDDRFIATATVALP